MTQETKVILIKRAKSLAWRIGMMALAAIVGFALESLELLELSPALTTVFGLVLGEVSKMLNTQSGNPTQ